MNRPLALAGFSALGALLVAICLLPPAAYGPLAAVLLLAALGAFGWLCVLAARQNARRVAPRVAPRTAPRAVPPLLPRLLLAALLAMGLALARLGVQYVAVERLLPLADGAPHTLEGVVYATGDGLYAGVVSARLKVTRLDGQDCRPFVTVCSNLEQAEVGQRLGLEVEFGHFTGAYRLQQYGAGVYLRATQTDAPARLLGQGRGLTLALARLRQGLGRRFLVLGRTAGGIAAAMVVGDRSYLGADLTGQFRQAGVSHLLVVSGLHLSLLCAALGFALRRLRPRTAALCSLAAVLFYMLLVGMTVSVVRAGVLVAMALFARLLDRAADPLTSLGLALLVLLGVNPYAACDMGLLLSFAATLGVLCFGALDARHFHLRQWGRASGLAPDKAPGFAPDKASGKAAAGEVMDEASDRTVDKTANKTPDKAKAPNKAAAGHARRRVAARLLGRALQALGTTAFATLFTLPVLAVQGTTLSAATLVCNLLCVPLVLPVMVLGWVFLLTHLVLGSARLLVSGWWLQQLLRLLQWVIATANTLFAGRLGVSGLLAAAVLCAAGLVALVLYHSRARRWCAVAALGCLALLWGLSATLNRDTVRVALVGGVDPAVVISQNGDCAVIFRGPRSGLAAVQEYLALHNLPPPQTVVDLSNGTGGEAVRQSLGRLDCQVRQDVRYLDSLSCLPGVQLTLVRQKEGALCYITVAGCSIGLNAGPVEVSGYPPCSVFLAGRSRPDGLRAGLVVKGLYTPDWLAQLADTPLYAGQEPVLWLRPGRAWRLLGARVQQAELPSQADTLLQSGELAQSGDT